MPTPSTRSRVLTGSCFLYTAHDLCEMITKSAGVTSKSNQIRLHFFSFLGSERWCITVTSTRNPPPAILAFYVLKASALWAILRRRHHIDMFQWRLLYSASDSAPFQEQSLCCAPTTQFFHLISAKSLLPWGHPTVLETHIERTNQRLCRIVFLC